jgi:mono/diheme cytochrome c family protein
MLSFKFVLSCVCLVPVIAFAADRPVIKKVIAPATSPSSGSEMFHQYCASCHGIDAKGNGPAAAALKVLPPDLTELSAKNHGKFPDNRVYWAIRGDVSSNAHGSADMPVWGTLFRDMANHSDDDRQQAMRMAALCRYIESLQQK